MNRTRLRRALPVVLGATGVGVINAVGGGQAPGAHLERQVARDYAAMGQQTADVSCGRLDAEVGARGTCEATTRLGAVQLLEARVTAVEGDDVRYRLSAQR